LNEQDCDKHAKKLTCDACKSIHDISNGKFCNSGSLFPRICKKGSVESFIVKVGCVIRVEDDIKGEVVLPETGFPFFFFLN